MTDKIQKTILYKRCLFSPMQQATLKDVMLSALTKRKSVIERREQVTADGSQVRFINHYRLHENCLCGVLLTFRPGASQPVISWDDAATELDITQIAPGLDEDQKIDFLNSMLFFAVDGNHVVLLTHGQSYQTFHRYIEWFLFDTEVISNDCSFGLINTPSEKATKALEGAKKIRFSTDFTRRIESAPDGKKKTSSIQTVVDDYTLSGFVELFKRLSPKKLRNQLDTKYLQQALKQDEISATLEVSVKRSSGSNQLANLLAQAVFNENDIGNHTSTKVRIKDGNFDGQDFLLTNIVQVPCDGGMPIVADAFEKMTNWIVELNNKGLIMGSSGS